MRGSRDTAPDPCPRCAPRVEALERENQRLRRRILDLEGLLEEARRSAKRQAAPFSKGAPKAHPKKPGRRRGRAYGVRARRPIPEQIDEVVDVPLPETCPRCREPAEAEVDHVVDQYQTDIPPVRPHVTHFRIHCGVCGRCGRPIRGRHPRQTSQAVGAAASQLGPHAVALAADLNKRGGLSYDKIVTLYRTAFGLVVSRGGVCQALQRLARAAEPTYKGLIQTVRTADMVSPDETGWRVSGQLHWLWVFVTVEVTVYALRPGRGFEDAAEILTPDFEGRLVRDGWAPYRRFTEAEHQSCLRHLLTRCGQMIEAAQRGAARFPHTIQRLLGTALDLRDRFEEGEISPHGLAVARGRLEAKLDRVLAGRITYGPNRRFRKHLTTERDHLFTFLRHEGLDATNWRAEQAIRPMVVTRKVWGGNRTWTGAHTQEVLASVLATCHQQGRDAYKIFEGLLCAPEPRAVALVPAGRARAP